MSGKLILVPTPIDETTPLETVALEILKSLDLGSAIIAVEELKECRRRWIRWGLDREWIDQFVLYNEHTRSEEKMNLLEKLKSGKDVYLMSDCGLPAFCDPGAELVDLCHDHKITVTSTPFANSISLALALSGFNHNRFLFEGFIPAKSDERLKKIKEILSNNITTIIMDTPYRYKKLVKELADNSKKPRRVFIAKNLNQETEQLLRLDTSQLAKANEVDKCEFILILE